MIFIAASLFLNLKTDKTLVSLTRSSFPEVQRISKKYKKHLRS